MCSYHTVCIGARQRFAGARWVHLAVVRRRGIVLNSPAAPLCLGHNASHAEDARHANDTRIDADDETNYDYTIVRFLNSKVANVVAL